MNRYWDLTEKQRSELTGDQVRAFLDVELMEKGVAKVADVPLQAVEEVDIPTVEYFGVKSGTYSSDDTGFVFATPEQAMQFITACPLKVNYNWECGCDRRYAEPISNLGVVPVKLATEATISNLAVILKRNKAAKDANEKITTAQRAAAKKIEDATSGVWDDWHACREKAAEWKKIAETRAEYVKLCDGNAEIAETFLAKVFSADEIAAALAWAIE